MEGRVLRAARDSGVDPDGFALLVRAHRAAMGLREAGDRPLPSDRHPDFLHPGRTALILLRDVAELNPAVLVAGILTETRDSRFRVSEATVRSVFGLREGDAEVDGVVWWRDLPAPDWGAVGRGSDGDLLERLVTAPDPVRRIALSEALDHLRHAHQWASPAERVRAVELAKNVFGPVAPRVHPVLDRRLQWWLRRVGRGLEKGH